jgi:hypothetical protein
MRGTASSITNTYTLNIDKALKKKLDATKRQQNVLHEYTRGGLVITADPQLTNASFLNSPFLFVIPVSLTKLLPHLYLGGVRL